MGLSELEKFAILKVTRTDEGIDESFWERMRSEMKAMKEPDRNDMNDSIEKMELRVNSLTFERMTNDGGDNSIDRLFDKMNMKHDMKQVKEAGIVDPLVGPRILHFQEAMQGVMKNSGRVMLNSV